MMRKKESGFYAQILHKGKWYELRQPQHILYCFHPKDVLPLLHELERETNAGRIAVGHISYEAATAFEPENFLTKKGLPFVPLVSFALFDKWPPVSSTFKKEQNFTTMRNPTYLSYAKYLKVFKTIYTGLMQGDIYQVNYSFRLQSDINLNHNQISDSYQETAFAKALFMHLYKYQQGSYSIFIDTAKYALCSASPECFFKLNNKTICCRPMKGTIRRGHNLKTDQENARYLQNDAKNLAENRMIVDLFRNDLAKIASLQSVQVTSLFELEAYPQVWQMISEVTAQTNAGLTQIFASLFPSASITGAPKIRASRYIHQLEDNPRGVYCGAVGYVIGRDYACFNTAIRTALIDKTKNNWYYGVGSGITCASKARSEYEECLLKGKMLETFTHI